MLIDIQSMFKDIIETPQQRRAAMQQEGEQQAQTAVGSLSGASKMLAPLIAQMARQQPERSAAMQRGMGGMLNAIPGIERETRTPSEQLQGALAGADTESEEGQAALIKTVTDLGYADQALTLQQQFAEQNRIKAERATAAAERAEDRGAITSANTVALERAERIEREAVTKAKETADFRQAAVDSIRSTASLTPAEKEAMTAQVLAGAFDTKPGDLFTITSPAPIKVGDNVVTKDASGAWVIIKQPGIGPDKQVSLQSAAIFQYGTDPEAMRVLEEGIASGAITDAKQFSDYAPKPEKIASNPAVSPVVEQYNIDGIEKSNVAARQGNKINTLLTTIYESDILENSPAGKWSDVVEGGKQFLGIRDVISEVRTALTGEVNLQLLESLPKGTASDKDVEKVAEGFPPSNASIAEVAAWLESAKAVLYRVQDFQTVSGQLLAGQLSRGQAATTIGLETSALPVLRDIDGLNFVWKDLERSISNGTISVEDAEQHWQTELTQFETEYKFIPSQYR